MATVAIIKNYIIILDLNAFRFTIAAFRLDTDIISISMMQDALCSSSRSCPSFNYYFKIDTGGWT